MYLNHGGQSTSILSESPHTLHIPGQNKLLSHLPTKGVTPCQAQCMPPMPTCSMPQPFSPCHCLATVCLTLTLKPHAFYVLCLAFQLVLLFGVTFLSLLMASKYVQTVFFFFFLYCGKIHINFTILIIFKVQFSGTRYICSVVSPPSLSSSRTSSSPQMETLCPLSSHFS